MPKRPDDGALIIADDDGILPDQDLSAMDVKGVALQTMSG